MTAAAWDAIFQRACPIFRPIIAVPYRFMDIIGRLGFGSAARAAVLAGRFPSDDGSDMSSLTITEVIMLGDATEFSDDQLRQFRDNPELFELISDRETLSLKNLWRLLVLSIGLVALSKLFLVNTGDEYDQFILTIAADLVFEMGAALIGSIATVIFIQFQEKRQFEENVKFRADVKKRIAALEAADV